MFYLTTHSTHFIYGYMASDIWLKTILIVRKETRCCHIGYSYRLTARVLLYALSHRQDKTYHGLCYTSRGALAGTRNRSHVKTSTIDTLSHGYWYGTIQFRPAAWKIFRKWVFPDVILCCCYYPAASWSIPSGSGLYKPLWEAVYCFLVEISLLEIVRLLIPAFNISHTRRYSSEVKCEI